MRKLMFMAVAVVLLAGVAAQAAGEKGGYATWTRTAAEVEAKTGGTYLDLTASDSSTPTQYSAPAPSTMKLSYVLGAKVGDPRTTPNPQVNWNLNDSSFAGVNVGNGVEDNNRRSGNGTDGLPPATGNVGAVYNPFTVTITGLVANKTYSLKVMAVGRYQDPTPATRDSLDAFQSDFGIGSMDFSYGASASLMQPFADCSLGQEIYSERTVYTNTNTANMDSTELATYNRLIADGAAYYTGLFACSIGDWTADPTGKITLLLGDNGGNTVAEGSNRTAFDGIVVVPEPATLSILGLGALAMLRKRK